jgi:hypothetical protein
VSRVVLVGAAVLAGLGPAAASATVSVSGPEDGSAFFDLDRPTGQFDETALSGFELLISSRTGEFRASDPYLIAPPDRRLRRPPGAGARAFAFDTGRRGQWLLGDDLDLVENAWELRGVVTLTRPDAALEDVTKVRLAVDLVRDPGLPFVPVAEPDRGVLLVAGLALWAATRRRKGPCPT